MSKLVIGTRKSQLAMAQTELAIEALKRGIGNLEYEVRAVQTTGDKILDRPLLSFGGKGIFIEEFERSLQEREIDIAVHSAKDMPSVLGNNLAIAATLEREDPRDVLVWRKGEVLEEKEHLVIGTGSKRREIQIKKLYPCECKLLRGNVNTRLNKLDAGEYDAIILAAAGLKRLGFLENGKYQFRFFEVSEMVPSGGQGIIALEAFAGTDAFKMIEKITNVDAYCRLAIERYILGKMDAGCHEPIGVYSEMREDKIMLHLMDGRGGMARYFYHELPCNLIAQLDAIDEEEERGRVYEALLSTVFEKIDKWMLETGCVEKGSSQDV